MVYSIFRNMEYLPGRYVLQAGVALPHPPCLTRFSHPYSQQLPKFEGYNCYKARSGPPATILFAPPITLRRTRVDTAESGLPLTFKTVCGAPHPIAKHDRVIGTGSHAKPGPCALQADSSVSR